jgi:hypothetical protein
MGLWKITEKGPRKVTETGFKHEKVLEESLEEWIARDPSILGENLLVIGRQVLIPDVKDRLDLLAVDSQGATVIIELKRGDLKDPVDIQALRYASYISKWRFEEFENLARNYLGRVDDPDFNFNEVFESFCEEAGTEVPELNAEQRLVIVGAAVREKLGSVALWLRDHRVDIKLIEVQTFREGDAIFIEPTVIVPVPVSRFAEVGMVRAEGSPWMVDGRTWHLEKRCSSQTKEVFLGLDKLLQDKFELEGPKWNQKHYVAYRVDNHNWLAINTNSRTLRLDFLVKTGVFKSDELAGRLGVKKFDVEDTMSEKMNLPSSVIVRNRNESSDRIRLRVKEGFDLESAAFLLFLEEAFKARLR